VTYSNVVEEALEEMRRKSQKAIYKRDPEAWVSDVLGNRWWSKQAEIAHSYTNTSRTAVKSANGTGKSLIVADLVCHWVSVHEPGEVIAIISAPTLTQIELVIFAYLKNNYGKATANGLGLPGRINESLQWKADSPSGIQTLAIGRKPQDQDIVGSFQGIRRDSGTAVFIDEAGSVPRDLFVAAEAVTTGGADHKIVAIGNPDLRGTAFHDLWTKPGLGQFWDLHTISAFDLPTFTGEVVYTDPVRQEAMLKSGMNTPEKVESWRITWGEDSARWQSKVLGEFPNEADNTFFSQQAINKALETEIEEDEDIPLKLGVDVALGGQDETKIYGNRGGRIRLMHTIKKMDSFNGAIQIHEFAVKHRAKEVRIDASGTGQGVHDNLLYDPQFKDAQYVLVGIKGGTASPDRSKWAQARSWHYDLFRADMLQGHIDLDLTDQHLQDEILAQTYGYNNIGGIQITPKLEMRKQGLKSPDHLDAAIYSAIDLSGLINDPLMGYNSGDKVRMSPEELIGQDNLPNYLDVMRNF
jgi:hypothetical protein